MASYAPHVYRDPGTLAVLQACITHLVPAAPVMLLLKHGCRSGGIVVARPRLQAYLDSEQRQGLNAQVRLEDLLRPMQQHVIWVDAIAQVQPLAPDELAGYR